MKRGIVSIHCLSAYWSISNLYRIVSWSGLVSRREAIPPDLFSRSSQVYKDIQPTVESIFVLPTSISLNNIVWLWSSHQVWSGLVYFNTVSCRSAEDDRRFSTSQSTGTG